MTIQLQRTIEIINSMVPEDKKESSGCSVEDRIIPEPVPKSLNDIQVGGIITLLAKTSKCADSINAIRATNNGSIKDVLARVPEFAPFDASDMIADMNDDAIVAFEHDIAKWAILNKKKDV